MEIAHISSDLHLILYINPLPPTPNFIDPWKFSAAFSILVSAAVLDPGSGKGHRV
jgi:hypothetical protein